MRTSDDMHNARILTGAVIGLFSAVIGIAVLAKPQQRPLHTPAPPPAAVSVSATTPEQQCAHDLLVERSRWYFEETGLTTDIRSGVPQAYANHLEALGVQPKRPLPFRSCS